MAGLPFLSVITKCLFSETDPNVAVDRTITSTGMIMTIKYNAVLLSLHRCPQYGCTFMLISDHWQLQLLSELTVSEALTP
jgi:hypothetical protein